MELSLNDIKNMLNHYGADYSVYDKKIVVHTKVNKNYKPIIEKYDVYKLYTNVNSLPENVNQQGRTLGFLSYLFGGVKCYKTITGKLYYKYYPEYISKLDFYVISTSPGFSGEISLLCQNNSKPHKLYETRVRLLKYLFSGCPDDLDFYVLIDEKKLDFIFDAIHNFVMVIKSSLPINPFNTHGNVKQNSSISVYGSFNNRGLNFTLIKNIVEYLTSGGKYITVNGSINFDVKFKNPFNGKTYNEKFKINVNSKLPIKCDLNIHWF